MALDRKSFLSSMLDGATYDDQTKTLTVDFNNGRQYTLEGVPPETWEGLKTAQSAGQYFNQNLKGQY